MSMGMAMPLLFVTTILLVTSRSNAWPKCPEVDTNAEPTFFPHETDCGKFYECSNGIPELFECPPGLHFNPNLNVCDWPVNAGCVSGSSPPSQTTEEGSGSNPGGQSTTPSIVTEKPTNAPITTTPSIVTETPTTAPITTTPSIVTEKPTTAPIITTPSIVTEKPTTEPITTTPSTVTEKPTTTPITTTPSIVTEKPTTAPITTTPSIVTEKPTTTPITTTPSIVTEKPTTAPITTTPSIVTEKPTTAPITTTPSIVTEKPTTTPITTTPSIVTEKPTTAPITTTPSIVTEKPTTAPITTTPSIVTEKPTTAPITTTPSIVTEKPTTAPITTTPSIVTEKPTTAPITTTPSIVTEKPTTAPITTTPSIVTEKPTTAPITTTPSIVTEKPTTAPITTTHLPEPKPCSGIVPREDWGGRQPTQVLTRPMPVTVVVIQHTVTPQCSSRASCSSQVRTIQQRHMDDLKYWDIGLPFLIGDEGEIYEGPGWYNVGAHTFGYNQIGIAISFIGTHNSVLPTQRAMDAAKSLMACGVEQRLLAADYKLYGQLQLTSTLSPGERLYREIQTWPHWTPT